MKVINIVKKQKSNVFHLTVEVTSDELYKEIGGTPMEWEPAVMRKVVPKVSHTIIASPAESFEDYILKFDEVMKDAAKTVSYTSSTHAATTA